MQLSVLDALEVLLAKILFTVGEEPEYLQTALACPSSPPWDPPQETRQAAPLAGGVGAEWSGFPRKLAMWEGPDTLAAGALSKNAGEAQGTLPPSGLFS